MRNITVMIEGSSKELYLSENIVVEPKNNNTVIKCVKATVFWNYKNVIAGVNDTFSHGGNLITVPEGYWTLNMLRKISSGCIVRVGTGASMYYDSITKMYINENGSGGFSVYSNHSAYIVNLGTFGTLLGFDKNFAMPTNKRWLSQKPADLNRGLRYITVSCDIVNEMNSSHADGKRSSILTTLPIPTPGDKVDLGKEITQYSENHNIIPIKAGSYNRLIFNVSTNIGDVMIGDILLELSISDE